MVKMMTIILTLDDGVARSDSDDNEVVTALVKMIKMMIIWR